MILVVVGSYAAFVSRDNENIKYRDESEDLLRWAAPLTPCIIDRYGQLEYGAVPLLGTDMHGGNIALRISRAILTNLKLAVLGSLWPFLLFGITAGILIGYDQSDIKRIFKERGRIPYRILQQIVDWLVEVLHAMPQLLLLLIAVVVTNKTLENSYTRMLVIMMSLGFISIPKLALTIKDRIGFLESEEFIIAAKASGLSDRQIIFRHILYYDMAGVIVSQITYMMLQSVMIETVVTFLGYGIKSSRYESIGKLIIEYQNDLPIQGAGSPLAIIPLLTLVIISIVGNMVVKVLDEQYA